MNGRIMGPIVRHGAASREAAATAALYILLLAGGVWHVLDVLAATMSAMAGPLLATLAAVVYLTVRPALGRGRDLWAGGVLLGGFVVEWAGVRSGLIFGEYVYGGELQPQLLGVPLAIGFAWVLVLISSAALAQRLLPQYWRAHPLLFSLAVAVLMTLFDAMLEPAAVALGYWTWTGGGVPVRNAAAWFVLGFLFSLAGARVGLGRRPLHPFAMHAWFAQAAYFLLAWLGKALPGGL
jgi:putative membrane protein